MVSAFSAEASMVLGQQATGAKSNEKTAIPELLATLALEGCVVTIDAMGTHAPIAAAIRRQKADYLLAVKDNQARLAQSIREFYDDFLQNPRATLHTFYETVEKEHGRLETRRCYAFAHLHCLAAPEKWPDLRSFAVVESIREIDGRVSKARRLYISSLPGDAEQILRSVRAHWQIENNLHWCLDVAFNDDQMRLREGYAAENCLKIKQLCLNLLRDTPPPRKASIKGRRLLASTSDVYRAQILKFER